MTPAQRDRAALETALLDLDGAWTVLADVRLGTASGAAVADYLLLHPRRGIALVDMAAAHRDPVPAVRAFLQGEAFQRFFPGDLPIVHVALAPDAAPALTRRLDDAFTSHSAALAIADGAWPDAVAALVSAQQARAASEAPNPGDLAPHMPRWQTVAAFASLAAFGFLWLSLPTETRRAPPEVEAAITPPAPVAPPPVAAEAPAPAETVTAQAPPEPEARQVQSVADLVHRNCRAYSSRVSVLGAPAEVRGFACQARDGSWEIMTEAPAAPR